MVSVSSCCCCSPCWTLHGAGRPDRFPAVSLCWCSPQNFLTLARYGNFWVDSVHVSSSVSCYPSLYLFFSVSTRFHLSSIPLSYFRVGYLLSLVYTPCPGPCLSCGAFSCTVILALLSYFRARLTLIGSSLCPHQVTTAGLHCGSSRLPAFCLSVEKPPNDRPGKHFYMWPSGFSRKQSFNTITGGGVTAGC